MAPPTAPTPAPIPACMRAPVGIVFATRPRLPLMAEPMAARLGAAFFSFPCFVSFLSSFLSYLCVSRR